jgi:hypothetical protein
MSCIRCIPQQGLSFQLAEPTSSDEAALLLTPPTTPIKEQSSTLAELIPIAAAKIKENIPQYDDDDDDGRVKTKLENEIIQVREDIMKHHCIKEKYLMKRWMKLALALPLNNQQVRRTDYMVSWFEHKENIKKLSIKEIENVVLRLEALV